MDNHVSFGNIVFGLASAQPSTGFVGCAKTIKIIVGECIMLKIKSYHFQNMDVIPLKIMQDKIHDKIFGKFFWNMKKNE